MPFEVLETQTKENMPPTASLSYLRSVRKGKEGSARIKPKLTVTLPTVICVSKCKKFRILVGTGQDRGKLRIEGLKPGVPGTGVKATDFKNHLVLRFGHVPKLGDEIFDGVRCPIVRLDDDTYELTLVDDGEVAFRDVSSPPAPSRPAATGGTPMFKRAG